jgi:hypothetical protein
MSDELDFVITHDEATARINRVRLHVESARDDIAALFHGRAWLTLGYESWDDLCDAEFSGVHIGLPRGERREVVGNLREQGLSTRAIASAVGVSVGTIHSDLSRSELNTSAVTGQDGKTYPAHITTTSRTTESTKVEQDVDTDTGEILDGPTRAGRAAADAVMNVVQGDAGYRQANLMRDVNRALSIRPPFEIDPVDASVLPFTDADVRAWDRNRNDVNEWLDKFMRARTGLRVINGGQ